MKTISIVLTNYPSHLSSFMETVYGYEYTHASICLDAMNEKMYSFNYKGFCMETVSKYKRHGVEKSISFQLQVTDAAFERLQNKIEQFVENREDFCYSSIGVVFCFVHIPFKRKKHYFCSQFVAEILAESGALKLKRRPSLYAQSFLPGIKGSCGAAGNSVRYFAGGSLNEVERSQSNFLFWLFLEHHALNTKLFLSDSHHYIRVE